jgi:hypothetical protein
MADTLEQIAERIVRAFMRADGSQAQLQSDILSALQSLARCACGHVADDHVDGSGSCRHNVGTGGEFRDCGCARFQDLQSLARERDELLDALTDASRTLRVCISACAEKRRMGVQSQPCLVCRLESAIKGRAARLLRAGAPMPRLH